MVNKAEGARLKDIEAEKAGKIRKLNKAAKIAAERAFFQNPEIAAEPEAPIVNVPAGWAAHITHDIRQMASHPISYCNICGWFAKHGTHSKLAQECEGLKRGSQTTLRLLQCDVVPRKGAKVPQHCRKRDWAPNQRRGT